MSIAVELTDEEIAQLRELTQQEDVAASLKTAVSESIRYRKRLELIELSGRIEMQDNWRELEEAELRAQH